MKTNQKPMVLLVENEHKIAEIQPFIGQSPSMQAIYQTIEKVAKSKVSVLITGEIGTGKELCAQIIHKKSQRKKKSFTSFYCTGIPKHLSEIELFGHVKGSFAKTAQKHLGAATLAHGGTLFLDEVGDVDLDLQSKLLRFVETGTFFKVGANQLEKVDVRFIGATHHNLLTNIKFNKFRSDLYHRLNVVHIHLPPLRERREDILLLAQVFLNKYAIQEGKKFKDFTHAAKKILLREKWQGNVRQLQNCIHNLVLLNDGNVITADMLRNKLVFNQRNTTSSPFLHGEPCQESHPHIPPVAIMVGNNIRSFHEIEKEVILNVLSYCGSSVSQVEKCLGISYATIYRKLHKWKIHLKRRVP